MNISHVRQLHERALRVVQSYLGAESELIEILQAMDESKGFRHYGAKSLFEYTTQILKLSEATTFNLITVARKSREIPALKEAIRGGSVTLSKARKTIPVLTVENQAKWIGLAQTLTSRELEREVAQARAEAAITRPLGVQPSTSGLGPRASTTSNSTFQASAVSDSDPLEQLLALFPKESHQQRLKIAGKLGRARAILAEQLQQDDISFAATMEAALYFYLEQHLTDSASMSHRQHAMRTRPAAEIRRVRR